MKSKKFLKIISLLVICVVFVSALMISSLAATSQNNVEIYRKNIIFGEKLQLMFAIDAPDYVDVTAVCGDDQIDIEYIGNETIDGKDCLIYRTVDGWAPQNINATVTVTATANGQTDVLTYSVLMYLYERLNLDNLDPVQEADRIAMYEALLAYAKATDKVINSENGKTPHDFDSYHYVSVVNGTLDGYNDWGMYKEGETPLANVEHIFDLADNEIVEWTYTLNGEDMGWIDYEDLKALSVEGAVVVTATRAIKEAHTSHDRCQPVASEAELEAAFTAGGKYYLTADIEVSKSMSTSSDVELCLNGHVLSATANEEVFSILSVSEGGSLVLNDCDTTERVGYIEDGKWIEGTKDGAETVTLTGGMITGGHANLGAAIWAKGDVEIYNVDFVNNTAAERGGAIFTMGALNVSGASFVCNEAALTGGAIHGEGGITFSVTDTAFISNAAKSTTHGGGALYVNTNAVGTFRGVTLIGNTSHRGGAVALHSGATLTVYSMTAKGNYADSCVRINEETNEEETVLGHGGVFILNKATLNLTEQSETDEIIIEGNNAVSGGAIHAEGTSTVNISGVEFNNNSAVSGGAIHAEGTSTVNISGAEFKNNTATGDNGGAINAKATSTVTVSGNSKFTGNTTTVHGGAISATKSTITVEGNVEFTNNTAANHGGAIYLTHSGGAGSTLTMTGGSFTGNSAMGGGAVSVRTGGYASFDGTEFTNNSVEGYADTQNGDGEGGGAIYAGYGELALKNVIMSDNIANGGYGGAVNAIYSDLTVEGGSFTSNTAIYGGAIRVHKCIDTEDVERMATISGAFFKENTATATEAVNGGAISATDSTLNVTNCTFEDNSASNGTDTSNQHGGAIYANNTTLTVSGTTFTGNTTGYYGGAIAAEASTVNITGGSVSGSTGITGAALWFKGCSDVEMNGIAVNNNSHNGKVKWGSGMVYITGGTDNTFKNVTAQGNTTGYAGAVFYVSGGTLTIDGGTFKGNTAMEGGVLHVSGSANVTVNSATFDSNTATSNGGAILVGGGTLTVNDASFTSNVATNGGGAIYVSGGNVTVNGGSFTSNSTTGATTSYKGGGAICAIGNVTVDINGATMTGNQSGYYGGTIAAYDATLNIGSDSEGNVTVIENSQGATGAAICYKNGDSDVSTGTYTIDGLEVKGTVGTGSGVIYINDGSLSVNNLAATNNWSKDGGIIHASGGQSFEIKNSTFEADDSACAPLGAINFAVNKKTLTLENITLTGSKATISGNYSATIVIRYKTEEEKTAMTNAITFKDTTSTISYVDISAE